MPLICLTHDLAHQSDTRLQWFHVSKGSNLILEPDLATDDIYRDISRNIPIAFILLIVFILSNEPNDDHFFLYLFGPHNESTDEQLPNTGLSFKINSRPQVCLPITCAITFELCEMEALCKTAVIPYFC